MRPFLPGNPYQDPTGPPMPNLAAAFEGVHDQLFRETLVLGLKRATIEIHSGLQNTLSKLGSPSKISRARVPGSSTDSTLSEP